jgi:hypothetical protein
LLILTAKKADEKLVYYKMWITRGNSLFKRNRGKLPVETSGF